MDTLFEHDASLVEGKTMDFTNNVSF